jgi:hypothetical protein
MSEGEGLWWIDTPEDLRRMESGKWRMERGGWRMENGKGK